jgi:alkaline phosphatase/alkaline phosphatase D
MYGSRPIVNYFKHIGGYFEKDDHDYRFDDADPVQMGHWINRKLIRPGISKITKERGDKVFDQSWLSHAEGIMVFKKVFPMSKKTYRTFRWGKGVQIWLLEGRDYRSPNAMPDGPDKTIWGAKQKDWLMSTLQESNALYKVIISPTPMIGPDRQSKKDNHANKNGFWTEGRNFLNWLKDNQMKNVILACGDRHWQYHSYYKNYVHEFSSGPTCDEHSVKDKPGQHPPDAAEFEDVEQPYLFLGGGFLTITYEPESGLEFSFYDIAGKEHYSYSF